MTGVRICAVVLLMLAGSGCVRPSIESVPDVVNLTPALEGYGLRIVNGQCQAIIRISGVLEPIVTRITDDACARAQAAIVRTALQPRPPAPAPPAARPAEREQP